MRISVQGSCEGCEYNSSEKYSCQSDWGFDHYCSHSCILSVIPSPHFPVVAISGGSDIPLRLALGESNNTPRWCPFVDQEAWEWIESQVAELTPSQIDQSEGT